MPDENLVLFFKNAITEMEAHMESLQEDLRIGEYWVTQTESKIKWIYIRSFSPKWIKISREQYVEYVFEAIKWNKSKNW